MKSMKQNPKFMIAVFFFFLISFYRCPLSCCAMVFCCPIDKRSNLVLMAVLVGLAIYKYTYINI